ncbi:MAG TPA: hypothetical protein VJH03_11765 [Blastocatellia bacterium]|nr:hypothetical protein [Blastocatellia bacterium]
MTLLLTEIWVGTDMHDVTIIFAADRRISYEKKFHALCKKIFRVPYLNAGIGFFGLAEVGQQPNATPMSDWLTSFITKNHDARTLSDFAHRLRDDLNRAVPRTSKISNPSGFHIAGFNQDGLPEFWYVRNIQNMDQHRYIGYLDRYRVTEDFLRRDASRDIGYDGVSLKIPAPKMKGYRNGDIRGHMIAWKDLNSVLLRFLDLRDFRSLRTIPDFEEFTKFKMELIANVYEKYCTGSSIGKPIDVFSIVNPASSNQT